MTIALSAALQIAAWGQDSGSDATTRTDPVPPNASTAVSPPAVNSSSAVRHTSDENLRDGEEPENRLIVPFVSHIIGDQRAFWTAPAHFHVKDLEWIGPFLGVTAGFMTSDSWIAKQVPAGKVQISKTFSDYGAYSLIAAGGGAFVLGHLRGDDRMSEAGLLSGEAAINSTAIAYLLKNVAQRTRPYQTAGGPTFFQGGSSFPSEHAAIAWSIASVMAHEYPGTLTKVLAYGLATGISATRVTGKQHFASDVIVGSALGWYFGRQVYRSHHNADLGGAAWGDLLPEPSGDKVRNPENMGSPYVPLDSWVYPAMERLIATGYIKAAYLGIRPWTRMACAEMVEEAGQKIGDDDDQSLQAAGYFSELTREFSPEIARLNGAANFGATIDSVYTRVTNISDTPLRDGYHFGQTLINDYGRPYGKGASFIAGASGWANAGPFAFYLQGEYQHSPANPSAPLSVLQAIASADLTTPVPNGRGEVNRLNLIQGAISFTWNNTQISFGKQSQWLGPGQSGSLLMSNNAEPVLMLKIDSVSPYRIPLLSKLLGPVRMEYFLGQLAGHQFELNGNQLLGPSHISPQPFLDGAKFSFKPTPDLEIGVGFTAQFGGPGLPFTFGNFIRTFYVHTQNTSTTTGNNPAKRIANADFAYRVPGLRDWLTLYGDFLTVDEISPIGSSRATVNPGIYMPKIPKMHNLELRAEGIHEPLTNEFAPGFVYYGLRRYRSGYTNDGNLMGNWIGRAGRGWQSWVTYSFTPVTNMQFGYRAQEVSHDFLQGGHSVDYSAAVNAKLSRSLFVDGFVQYERWRFPILSSYAQSDFSSGFRLTFRPSLLIRK